MSPIHPLCSRAPFWCVVTPGFIRTLEVSHWRLPCCMLYLGGKSIGSGAPYWSQAQGILMTLSNKMGNNCLVG
jgi:hypothetical protein